MSLTTIYLTSFFFFYTQEVARLLFTDTIFIKGDIASADLVLAAMGENILTHMKSFCPMALKGHFRKDTPYDPIARDLTF